MAYKKLAWQERYSIGVEEIDNQHKKLLGIVNKFMAAKEEGHAEDAVRDTLIELVDYTKYHFSSEEKHMKANKYFGLPEQERQHKALIKQIVQILQHMKQGKLKIDDELYSLLKTWLVKHIIDHDKQYGYFLEDQ